MQTLWFVNWEEAKGYLTAQGFVFMGAPNRWRRIVDDVATYAIVRVSGSGASIVLRPGASDIGEFSKTGGNSEVLPAATN
jgi:hypothetical protein